MTLEQIQPSSGDTELTALDVAPADGWNAIYVARTWSTGRTGEQIPITNSATQEEIGTVPSATEADVDAAYETAARAQTEWG